MNLFDRLLIRASCALESLERRFQTPAKKREIAAKLAEQQELYRIGYELLAHVERMDRAEATRSNVSRAREGKLHELWIKPQTEEVCVER